MMRVELFIPYGRSHENHCVQLLPPMTLCLKHLGQKSHPSCEDFDKWISCVPGPPLSCRVPVSAPQTAPQKVSRYMQTLVLKRTTGEMDLGTLVPFHSEMRSYISQERTSSQRGEKVQPLNWSLRVLEVSSEIQCQTTLNDKAVKCMLNLYFLSFATSFLSFDF